MTRSGRHFLSRRHPRLTARKTNAPVIEKEAKALAEAGQLDEATTKFQQAFDYDPARSFSADSSSERAANYRAWALRDEADRLGKAGKFDEALVKFKEASALYPSMAITAAFEVRHIPDSGLSHSRPGATIRTVSSGIEPERDRKFCAFLSYRHLDNAHDGRRWAEWLHHGLENYRVPEGIRKKPGRDGQPVRSSLYPVFRDEEEMVTAKPLGELVEEGLKRSDWLIVLCTPRSAESPWVNAEVDRFKELGKAHRIIAVLIDGEPGARARAAAGEAIDPNLECLPRSLRSFRNDAAPIANQTASERLHLFDQKLAADFRPEGKPVQGYTSAAAYRNELDRLNQTRPLVERSDRRQLALQEERYNDRLRLMQLKIVAGILGVDLGELTQRDAEARARRFRRLTFVWGLVSIILLASFIFALRNEHRAEKAQKEAERQSYISLARALAAEAPRLQGQEKLDEIAALMARQAFVYNQRYGGDALAQVDAALRTVLSTPGFSVLRPGIGGRYNDAAWSPSGWTMAAGSPSRNASLWNWNKVQTPLPQSLIKYPPAESYVAVAVSTNGNGVVYATDKGDLLLADRSRPEAPRIKIPTPPIFARALAMDGDLLAIGGQSGEFRLIHLRRNPLELAVLHSDGGEPVTAVALSSKTGWVTWGTTAGIIRAARLENIARGNDAQTVLLSWGKNVEVTGLVVGGKGEVAASGWVKPDESPTAESAHLSQNAPVDTSSPKNPIVIVDASTKRILRNLGPWTYWSERMAFSPSGRFLAVGSIESALSIWDLAGEKAAPSEIKGHKGSVNAIAWNATGTEVCSMDIYGNARISLIGLPGASPSIGLRDPVLAIAVNSGDETLLTISVGGRLNSWNPVTGEITKIDSASWDTKAAAISHDGNLVALASGHSQPGHGVTLRSRSTNMPAPPPASGFPAWAETVAFYPDGTLVMGCDSEIRWLQPGEDKVRMTKVPGGWIRSMAISNDGERLVTGGDDGCVKWWRRAGETLVCERTITVSKGQIRALAIGDNYSVAAGSFDGQVVLLSATGEVERKISDHRGIVTAAAFLGTKLLATGGEDGTVRIYTLGRHEAPVTLRAEHGGVNALAWQTSTRHLAAGYSDGQVIAWITETSALAEKVGVVVGRNFTATEWQRYVGDDVPYDENIPTKNTTGD